MDATTRIVQGRIGGNMVGRKENGHIYVNDLDMRIFFDDLFSHCKTEKEIDFVLENIQTIVEDSAEEQEERVGASGC